MITGLTDGINHRFAASETKMVKYVDDNSHRSQDGRCKCLGITSTLSLRIFKTRRLLRKRRWVLDERHRLL